MGCLQDIEDMMGFLMAISIMLFGGVARKEEDRQTEMSPIIQAQLTEHLMGINNMDIQ